MPISQPHSTLKPFLSSAIAVAIPSSFNDFSLTVWHELVNLGIFGGFPVVVDFKPFSTKKWETAVILIEEIDQNEVWSSRIGLVRAHFNPKSSFKGDLRAGLSLAISSFFSLWSFCKRLVLSRLHKAAHFLLLSLLNTTNCYG